VTFTSILQHNDLREQRLQFIRAHQQAFDVDPIFPLQLFEEFVARVKGDCMIEASCKVEIDKLIASRFLLFFQDQNQPWPSKLAQALDFFHQVEHQVGVQVNDELLQRFLGKNFDFSKMTLLSTGVDLRPNLAESSLKMHISIRDYPEKVATALALDGSFEDSELYTILLNTASLIGFDYYLDGQSDIEIYASLGEQELKNPNVRTFLQKNFSQAALHPLEASSVFYTGLSKGNSSPVLYYALKDKKDLQHYFRLNDTAQRVQGFYQDRETVSSIWVGVAEQELQKSRIENIRLYYHKRFAN
jgi:LynF/TruF/PatF family peptide O-prenyltransferase